MLLSVKIEQREEFPNFRFHRQSVKIAKTNGISNVNIEKKKTSLSDFADSD